LSNSSRNLDTGRTAAPPHVYACRCEEVTVDDVSTAIAGGLITLNDIKRRTRAGMGLCQGIYCLSEISRLIQEMTGQSPQEVLPMTMRPPTRQVTLGMLADAIFDERK
jgi:NAD(P)H-nitrite reductase large subunit